MTIVPKKCSQYTLPVERVLSDPRKWRVRRNIFLVVLTVAAAGKWHVDVWCTPIAKQSLATNALGAIKTIISFACLTKV